VRRLRRCLPSQSLEPPELGWAPGDVVTYRCRDCADVWYLEVDEDDLLD
jgi:hypothetical protein